MSKRFSKLRWINVNHDFSINPLLGNIVFWGRLDQNGLGVLLLLDPWKKNTPESPAARRGGFVKTWRVSIAWIHPTSLDYVYVIVCYCVCVLHLTFALLCPSMMLSHSKMAPANTYDKAWRHTFQVFWDWHSHSTAHSHKGTLPWCQGRGAFSWLIGSESIFPS